jgi:hypothetical protein
MNVDTSSIEDGSICPAVGDEEPGAAAGSGGEAGLPAVGRSRRTLRCKRRGWDWKQMGILRDAWERKLPL